MCGNFILCSLSIGEMVIGELDISLVIMAQIKSTGNYFNSEDLWGLNRFDYSCVAVLRKNYWTFHFQSDKKGKVGSKHTSVFILTHILTLRRHFSFNFLKCVSFAFDFILEMRYSRRKPEKTFFEVRKLISLCSLWISSADKAFVDLKSSGKLQTEYKIALQLIIAMVNYMKDRISLLGLSERVMTGLDSSLLFMYLLVLIDYSSSVED